MLKYFQTIQQAKPDSIKKFAAILGGVLLLVIFISIYLFYGKNIPSGKISTPKVDFRSALESSVSGADPKPLQDFFANQVKNKINNKDTKSSIYWITHRYFDNGGNIYEIYDFVNANPDVAFLKEAEAIFPGVFKAVKERKAENWGSESILALLAYYEVIDRYGYADIAVWGIAANKFSEFAVSANKAHKANPKRKYSPEETSPLKFRALMTGKSMFFINKTKEYLLLKTQKTRTLDDLYDIDMIPDDLLVGLNQFGSALENIKNVGVVISLPFSTKDIYEFNNKLAETKVPRLYFFTNYLYAASLIFGESASAETVKVPLSRLVTYAETTPQADWRKSVSRVINSKTANESGMYTYEVTKKLASLDKGFKNWLKKNGWKDSDF